jgi:hypothetical protein
MPAPPTRSEPPPTCQAAGTSPPAHAAMEQSALAAKVHSEGHSHQHQAVQWQYNGTSTQASTCQHGLQHAVPKHQPVASMAKTDLTRNSRPGKRWCT